MIFSKKKKITIAYTVIQCTGCGSQRKRKFDSGDTLFAELTQCDSCGKPTRIEKIFGESFDQ